MRRWRYRKPQAQYPPCELIHAPFLVYAVEISTSLIFVRTLSLSDACGSRKRVGALVTTHARVSGDVNEHRRAAATLRVQLAEQVSVLDTGKVARAPFLDPPVHRVAHVLTVGVHHERAMGAFHFAHRQERGRDLGALIRLPLAGERHRDVAGVIVAEEHTTPGARVRRAVSNARAVAVDARIRVPLAASQLRQELRAPQIVRGAFEQRSTRRARRTT